ncbi:MAG TPA: DegQ family serine endoprotease [Methylomirabilota bacterium]|nr:DegQ family serine endoprotease [Methylomirabilota bacterium]
MLNRRSWLAPVLALNVGLTAGLLGSSLAAPGAAGPPVTLAAAPISASTFAKLAERVKPAVVNVNTEGRTGGRSQIDEFYGEDFFRRFFGEAPERMPRRSLGSGVIIDASGIALTNAHVVDGAGQIEVVTLDGSKHKATLVGMDKKTDLAVLRLNGGKGPFPALPLGDSNETQVGDWVIAVGSPFGLQATVTAGIISAKARHIGAGPYDDFLQTDAAINPGNSGGPLVNMRGEVVGINTAIVRGGSGIGFAIPSAMARRISTELTATGKVTRGWLGVSLQPLTPDLAASFGAGDRKGVLVADVVAGSPAAAAGVKQGDVVLRVDGKPVDDPGDLARAVGLARPGQQVKLTVWRDRHERALDVTLKEAPAERQASRLGLQVQPVTPEIARRLDLKAADGVVVTAVEDGSAASRAGLQRGDVILEVNREPVKSLADFERLTRDGERVALLLRRGGTSLYVALSPAEGR